MPSVIILGAKGRFGRAAVHAFSAAGWEVTEVARSWSTPGAGRVTLDATDASALAQAARGHDVIANALNSPYWAWTREIPRLTSAVVGAARASGATVMIPGNVYNYGSDMPAVLREDTPWRPTTRKGEIRVRMENEYRESGVPTIVLRGGDFIETASTDNWFDRVIAAKAWRGKVVYPGPRDVVHAWAWLPDMARAMTALADRRSEFDTFEEFGFPGFGLTGNALARLISKAVGQNLYARAFPWALIRLMGLWNVQMREVIEMRYLWDVPHRIDGTKLAQALPGFEATVPEDAIAAALATRAVHSQSNGTARAGAEKRV